MVNKQSLRERILAECKAKDLPPRISIQVNLEREEGHRVEYLDPHTQKLDSIVYSRFGKILTCGAESVDLEGTRYYKTIDVSYIHDGLALRVLEYCAVIRPKKTIEML